MPKVFSAYNALLAVIGVLYQAQFLYASTHQILIERASACNSTIMQDYATGWACEVLLPQAPKTVLPPETADGWDW